MYRKFATLALLAAVATFLVAGAPAQPEDTAFELTIRNHRFEPAVLEIPKDTRVKLRVTNADASPEEFESRSLNREKLIPQGTTATIYVGPLAPGTYRFFGEFHEDTAQGRIVVK